MLHISQLKLDVGFKGSVSKTLHPSIPEFSVSIHILQTCGVTKGSRGCRVLLLPRKIAMPSDSASRSLLLGVKPGSQGTWNGIPPMFLDQPQAQSIVPQQRAESVRMCRANARVHGLEWV